MITFSCSSNSCKLWTVVIDHLDAARIINFLRQSMPGKKIYVRQVRANGQPRTLLIIEACSMLKWRIKNATNIKLAQYDVKYDGELKDLRTGLTGVELLLDAFYCFGMLP